MNDEQKRARVEEIFQHELEMFDFDAPIDILTYTISEDSFLHIAAFRGNMEAVKLLVELGIDINALGDMSYTALHLAAKKGYDDIYNYLISKGAATDIVSEFGTTALDEKERRKEKERK